jgi:DNA modification methylase
VAAENELTWTNDTRHLSELIPWVNNPRQIGRDAALRLADSWQRYGQPASVSIGPNDELYDGHQRLQVWLSAFGDIEIDVRVASRTLTEEERRQLVAYLHAGTNASWDWDILAGWPAEELHEWGFDEVLLDTWNDDAANLALMLEAEKEPVVEDPGAKVDQAEELQKKWGTALGQLWEIPSNTMPGQVHRLVCGDSTSEADVGFAMDGGRAALLVTDPPYGVSYADKNEYLNRLDGGNRLEADILGDHQSIDGMASFWECAFSVALAHLLPGANYYITGPNGDFLFRLLVVLQRVGLGLRHMLIWVKNNHVLSRRDYQCKHEPIIYGWIEGGHKFYGDRGQMPTWEFDKPQRSELHPTTKPLGLYAKAIANSSTPGAIVLDPFVGSGTALVASEQLGRQCRAVELDPRYVAVALERLAGMGLEPRLTGTIEDYTSFVGSAANAREQDTIEEGTVADSIWPSDNDFDIPTLRLDMQADQLDVPVVKWGQIARGSKVAGTYHFYTDDYKFAALWDNPEQLVNSGCPSAVEPNFSVHLQTPRVLTLVTTYKKRWLARYWQEQGVRIWVDLGVPPDVLDLCCTGVPDGWRAFATRVYEGDDYREELDRQYQKATAIRGSDDVLFVVFGKSQKVKAYCQDNGWLYVKSIQFGGT